VIRLQFADELFTFVTMPVVTQPNGATKPVDGTNNQGNRIKAAEGFFGVQVDQGKGLAKDSPEDGTPTPEVMDAYPKPVGTFYTLL
jgi:hypothetical protein